MFCTCTQQTLAATPVTLIVAPACCSIACGYPCLPHSITPLISVLQTLTVKSATYVPHLPAALLQVDALDYYTFSKPTGVVGPHSTAHVTITFKCVRVQAICMHSHSTLKSRVPKDTCAWGSMGVRRNC